MPFPQSLLSLFSAHEATPPPAGMRTIPCTGLDLLIRSVVVTAGFIIHAQLDAKRLEDTLKAVIERKFPRVGARLARRNGVYEFQIPCSFDANTPPVAFTAEHYPEAYRSSPRPALPMDFPDSLGDVSQPSIHPMPELDMYFKSSQCPTSLAGFLVPNTPLLHVHVAVFDDLTFIGLTASHVLWDALGRQTVLLAWTRVLSGEAIESISGMEWDAAPFEVFAGPAAGTTPRGWYKLGMFSQLLFIARRWFHVTWDPKAEVHIVRVPMTFLDASKREINEELQRQGSSEWVGSSDVLMAWWFKTAYGHRRISDSTPIHLKLAVDLRDKRIFPGESALPGPYINNAVMAICVPPIPASACRTESLAELALRLRRAITAYNADPTGIAGDLQWRCAHPLAVRFPCPPDGEYMGQSNWRKARFGALDFSGACVGEKSRPRVMCWVRLTSNRPMHGVGVVLMEDEDAVWMSQVRGFKDWENIRRSGMVVFA